ncbi:MAG TPA: transglycosylase domain-containing protein [Candidatus Limnocylindria bacterium]|nr:transglycosylase domain-containing protein [Candidatus Limnocylindria bacterium]
MEFGKVLGAGMAVAGLAAGAVVVGAENRVFSETLPAASSLPAKLEDSLICPATTNQEANNCTVTNALGVLSAPSVELTLEDTGTGQPYLRPVSGERSYLEQAVVANEDRTFYEHRGVDDMQVLKAGKHNLENWELERGGSTITMQLVDLLYGSGDGVNDKVTEARRALLLEKEYEKKYGPDYKDYLLLDYLNIVPGPRGTRGVEASLQAMHGISAKDADIEKAATVTGAYTAPSDMDISFTPDQTTRIGTQYGPFASFQQAHPDQTLDDQLQQFAEENGPDAQLFSQYVNEVDRLEENFTQSIEGMDKTGAITQEEAGQNLALIDGIPENDARPDSEGLQLAPFQSLPKFDMAVAEQIGARHFTAAVQQSAARILKEEGIIEDPAELSMGYRIYTTLDPAVQQTAHTAVQELGYGPDDPEVALTYVDREGLVQAMIGGRGDSQVNLATAERQIGSDMKPFFFVNAVLQGDTPSTPYPAPEYIEIPGANNGQPWGVHGATISGSPEVPLDRALAHSLNTVYAQVAERHGTEGPLTIARDLGVEVDPENAPLSTVLGTNNGSTLDLAEAYTGLMGDGRAVQGHTITEIYKGNRLVYKYEPPEGKQVIPEEVANQVAEAAKGTVTEGTAASSFTLDDGNPNGYAAKTGTTQDNADARFTVVNCIGTVSVWEGYPDEAKPMPGHYGAGTPAQVANRFFGQIPAAMDPACDVAK